jgi:hypothetical protein
LTSIDRVFLKNADAPPMEASLQAMHFGTLPAKIGTDLLATAYVAARALTLPLSLICEPSGATWQLLAFAFHSAWALSLTLALAAWLRSRTNRPPATPAAG